MKYSLQCHHSYFANDIDSHVTLVYLGEQPKRLMDSVPLGELLISLENYFPMITSTGKNAYFGPNQDIPVRMLEPNNQLIAAQAIAQNFFFRNGIDVPITYPYYRPHITIPVVSTTSILGKKDVKLFLPHLAKWEDD